MVELHSNSSPGRRSFIMPFTTLRIFVLPILAIAFAFLLPSTSWAGPQEYKEAIKKLSTGDNGADALRLAAMNMTARLKDQEVTELHLLYELLNNPKFAHVRTSLEKMDVDVPKLTKAVNQEVSQLPGGGTDKPEEVRVPTVFQDLFINAEKLSKGEFTSGSVTNYHLLYQIASSETPAGKLLKAHKVTSDSIKTKATELHGKSSEWNGEPSSEKGVLETIGTDLTLKAEHGKIDPMIGRSQELKKVVEILSHRKKNNPILLGEAGVGKTAIAEGLALLISGKMSEEEKKGILGTSESDANKAKELPDAIKGKKVIVLSMDALKAGANQGELKRRALAIEKELEAGGYIVFWDEVHTIVSGENKGSGENIADSLKPILARQGGIIGATTHREYRMHIVKDGALDRRFKPVMVDEPTHDQTVEILKGIRSLYETHHGVTISDEVIERIVDFSERYLPGRYNPDKAIDLMDAAAARANMEKGIRSPLLEGLKSELDKLSGKTDTASLERAETLRSKIQELETLQEKIPTLAEQISSYRGELQILEAQIPSLEGDPLAKATEQKESLEASIEQLETELRHAHDQLKISTGEVTHRHAAEEIHQQKGVSVERILESSANRLKNAGDRVDSDVPGQKHVVDALIKSYRNRFRDKSKPIGVFLVAGEPHSGIDRIGKSLAKHVVGNEKQYLEIDLADYASKEAAESKIKGATAGYVGYEDSHTLVETLRRNPHAVVVLKNAEKAHESALQILLTAISNGKLVDNQEVEANLSNMIFIFETNKDHEMLSMPLDEVKKNMNNDKLETVEEGLVIETTKNEQFRGIVTVTGTKRVMALKPITVADLETPVARELERMQGEASGIQLELGEGVREVLARLAHAPGKGIANVGTVMEEHIALAASELIDEKGLKQGDKIKFELPEGGAEAFEKGDPLQMIIEKFDCGTAIANASGT